MRKWESGLGVRRRRNTALGEQRSIQLFFFASTPSPLLISSSHDACLVLSYNCAAKALPKMQAPVYGGQGVLPQLPGAIHVEPGKLRKCRLPLADAYAALSANTLLAIYVYWSDRAIKPAKFFAGRNRSFPWVFRCPGSLELLVRRLKAFRLPPMLRRRR